jgi:HAD superfamily hydrolase (TIGR01490 family)
MNMTAPRSNGTPRASARRLALFDLDHTLLPIDSDYEWARFLGRVGAIDALAHQSRNEHFMRQYEAGTLDIFEFLEFQLAPLARHDPARLAGWHDQYMNEVIRPAIREEARNLVDRHLQAGDLCALVTATNEFVTAPIAREFGLMHLVATGIESVDGRYTGRPRGTPAFREGKIVCTEGWLAELGLNWGAFEQSWFYSDSANDLPLLSRVSHPVATNPDTRLERVAIERGWSLLRLFE